MRREVLVERDEQPAERRRRLRQRVAHEPEHRDAAPLELVVAPDARRGGAARRRASRCRSASGGRRAPSCARRAARRRRASGRSRRLVVGEQLDRERREPVRLAQPARLAGRDVQLEQAVGDVGVVLEVARALRDAVAPRAVQAAVRRRERAEQELARARRPARRRPACASAASISPFHDAIALSSRGGFGRCSRSAKQPRARLRRRARRAARSARPRTAAAAPRARPRPAPSVNVSPSTPSVSASCAEAKPPPSSASSRST